MRFGLDIAQQRVSFAEVLDRARTAERLGFTGAWGFDHFTPMYGEGPGECFEGMTTLAALATATSTIRLGMLVTGVTYRHPSVFAAQALTIDHASNGRYDMAMGAAWAGKEHHELGIPFPSAGERFDLLEDALEIVTRLFTGDRVSYEGRQISLDEAQLRPLPVQRPHPPLWIGGSGRRRTVPLVARYADVWHAGGVHELRRTLRRGRPAGRTGRTRSRRHLPRRVLVDLRTVAGGAGQDRGAHRAGSQLPDLRLAGAGRRPGERIRDDDLAGLLVSGSVTSEFTPSEAGEADPPVSATPARHPGVPAA